MKIPLRNVFYLLCYAWDHYEEGEATSFGLEDFPRLQDLLGSMLARGIRRILRRGLHREYLLAQDELPGIRGRVLFPETLKRQLLIRGRTACEYDELTANVVHNRIVVSTLTVLLRLPELDRGVRQDLRNLRRRLHAVHEIQLDSGVFRRVHLHRNNRAYAFVLSICRLVTECLLVDAKSGDLVFRDLRDDDVRMWQLFQDFVFNFYRREQSQFSVTAPMIGWQDAVGTPADLERLPTMRTDVVLSSAERVIILDSKFYQQSLQEHFGRKSVWSGNLYQLLAYLDNWGTRERGAVSTEGMLLYPAVDESFWLDYSLRGRKVRVATVDLNQPWPQIRERLLQLVA